MMQMTGVAMSSGKNENFLKVKIKKLCLVFFLVSFTVMLFVITNASQSREIREQPQVNIPLTKDTYIFVITPTYARPVQKAELTRMSHTLKLVPHVHWIIVEDAKSPTSLVTNLLKNSGLPHTQLIQPTPPSWKLKSNEGRWYKPRGVVQRNAALKWIRDNLKHHDNGVIYFADDDNTYSLELFEEAIDPRLPPFLAPDPALKLINPKKSDRGEYSVFGMRKTKKVSIWPVGLVGGLYVEKPIVEEGKVVGFNSAWRPERRFPIDMAGFAVSLKHFLSKPGAEFSYKSEGGFQETDFLSLLTTRDELEPMANNCTKVLVWHTRSEKPTLVYEEERRRKGEKPSNFGIEV